MAIQRAWRNRRYVDFKTWWSNRKKSLMEMVYDMHPLSSYNMFVYVRQDHRYDVWPCDRVFDWEGSHFRTKCRELRTPHAQLGLIVQMDDVIRVDRVASFILCGKEALGDMKPYDYSCPLFYYAAAAGKMDLCRYLVQNDLYWYHFLNDASKSMFYETITLPDDEEPTTIFMNVYNAITDIFSGTEELQFLLNTTNNPELGFDNVARPPLLMLCHLIMPTGGKKDILVNLISHPQCDIDCVDSAGQNILHYACQTLYQFRVDLIPTIMQRAQSEGKLDQMRHHKDMNGETPVELIDKKRWQNGQDRYHTGNEYSARWNTFGPGMAGGAGDGASSSSLKL